MKDHLWIAFDGASQGNPGPSSFGVVLSVTRREVIETHSEAIGHATCNEAEWRGLIWGLRRAKELGARTVSVCGDSKLIVSQFNGRWKIKNPRMRKLYSEAREAAKGMRVRKVKWVPRERNQMADDLANEALGL